MRLPEPTPAKRRATHKLTHRWRLQRGCVLCRGHIPGSACVRESASSDLRRPSARVAARSGNVGLDFVEPACLSGGPRTSTRIAARSGCAQRPVFDQSWCGHAGSASDPKALTPIPQQSGQRTSPKGAPSIGPLAHYGSVAECRSFGEPGEVPPTWFCVRPSSNLNSQRTRWDRALELSSSIQVKEDRPLSPGRWDSPAP